MTSGATILLALTVLFWVILVAVLGSVVGQHASGDAAMGQAITWIYVCVLVVLTWIALSALLVVAGSHDLLPAWAGVMAVFLLPASCAATFGAIYLLDTTPARWPYTLPVVIPGLLAAYVFALHHPSWRPEVAGWVISPAVWGIVAVLSIAVWPAVAYKKGEAQRNEAARKIALADPVQKAQRRQAGLARLKAMPPDSPLEDWSKLLLPESEVRVEALEILRKSERRQSDMERLAERDSSYLSLVPELDLQATESLCRTLNKHLWNAAFIAQLNGERRHLNPADDFDASLETVPWFSAHGCDCSGGLSHIEENVRKYYADSPERQQALERLAKLRSPR